MPPQQPNVSVRKETKVLFSDSSGKPILELGNEQYTIHSSTGITYRNISECVPLCDGFVFNPTMLLGGKISLAICPECRKTSHGLVTVHLSKICSKCGKPNLCSRHRKLIDNQYFCLSCARKYKWSKFFRKIFFEETEE